QSFVPVGLQCIIYSGRTRGDTQQFRQALRRGHGFADTHVEAGREKTGVMEWWSLGVMVFPKPTLHHSNTPLLQSPKSSRRGSYGSYQKSWRPIVAKHFAFVVILLLCLSSPASTLAGQATGYDEKAIADFYRGKVVTIIVGHSAGGGFDRYARAIARYIAKYIPGNPAIWSTIWWERAPWCRRTTPIIKRRETARSSTASTAACGRRSFTDRRRWNST